jgi:hypothetical protein
MVTLLVKVVHLFFGRITVFFLWQRKRSRR